MKPIDYKGKTGRIDLLVTFAICALFGGGCAFRSPNTADVRSLSDVTHLTIKGYSPRSDGINWLHGVALCFHGDRLYASFGTNTGVENTCGECLHIRSSDDGGQTWSASSVIASGSSVHGVSHGSLASLNGTLWAFAGAFSNGCSFVHTRAYRMEASGEWTDCGAVIGGGFWPMQNPIRLPNGNWIMGGLRAANGWNAAGGNRPAVAVSEGDDFTKWRLVVLSRGVLPASEWGEATVDLSKGVLTLTCRPSWGESPMVSHVAKSTDGGLTWSALEPTDCRVVTAKPFTGTLSDGRRYLISTITSDGGARRSPLMIAWSRRNGTDYSFAAAIRTCGNGVSLSYPSAVEHNGKLYVGYSDNGGRRGANVNSAELAVIPLTALDEPSSAALTGHRHHAVRDSKGRWTIAFRDVDRNSPYRNHFCCWRGTYDDIVKRNDREKIKLLPGDEVMAFTYIKHRKGPEKHSTVGVRIPDQLP